MSDKLLQLDPAKVRAESNIRFSLKPTSIQQMKDSIIEQGGIIVPVEVSKLEGKQEDGCTHRLNHGFIRHAALLDLNTKQDAGLTLPAIERESEEGGDRIKRQVAENNERDNMSPMDKANAIKMLLDAGTSRGEIRRIFSSSGGRKGNEVAPMSNAMLNILHRLLELPKGIQDKIHDGRVGVEAAYALGKVPPDKRAAVIERAEAARLAQLEAEEKDEERYLESERKAAEAMAKVETVAKGIEETEAQLAEAVANVEKADAARKEVGKMEGFLDMTKEQQAAATEKVKAADADLKAAMSLAKKAKNELAKAHEEKKKAEEKAEAQQAVLEAARKAVKGKKKTKAVGKADVEKAAKETGATSGAVPLNIGEIRQTLKDCIKEGVPSRVQQVAKLFKDCFDGKDTTKELQHNLEAFLKAVEKAAMEKVKGAKPAA